jgi:multidrug efflux pump subunit AcrB
MKVRAIAEDVRGVMAMNPRVVDPHLNWGEQAKSIRVEVDQDRARAIGLTPKKWRKICRLCCRALPSLNTARASSISMWSPARLRPSASTSFTCRPSQSRNGVAVPLSQFARLNYEYEEPILWQRNRDTVLTVRGDIIDNVQAPDVTKEVLPNLKPIMDALSYGYRIETGGAIEESVKANGALVAVFPVMAIAMLSLLMIQLQSFSRLALVFATAPLGLIGATGALLISNRPFGFVALLGLIALAGMIMPNTVILVDQIERDIAAGHGRYRAHFRRYRAVLPQQLEPVHRLTTATTRSRPCRDR